MAATERAPSLPRTPSSSSSAAAAAEEAPEAAAPYDVPAAAPVRFGGMTPSPPQRTSSSSVAAAAASAASPPPSTHRSNAASTSMSTDPRGVARTTATTGASSLRRSPSPSTATASTTTSQSSSHSASAHPPRQRGQQRPRRPAAPSSSSSTPTNHHANATSNVNVGTGRSATASSTTTTTAIRHAGRVSVRGMIRRIWRPRYLELYDDGTVRYYESSPDEAAVGTKTTAAAAARSGDGGARTFASPRTTASSAFDDDEEDYGRAASTETGGGDQWDDDESSWDQITTATTTAVLMASPTSRATRGRPTTTTPNHPTAVKRHRHRPKSTLSILHARIIDPSTLRDVHVGLPKGSYGFVFRGRHVGDSDTVNEETGDKAKMTAERAVAAGTDARSGDGSPSSLYSRSSSSGGALAMMGAAAAGGSALLSSPLQQVHAGVGGGGVDLTGCHPTMLPQSYSSTAALESGGRDYLCAVDGPDEAEAWVVALRWAASMAVRKRRAAARGGKKTTLRQLSSRPEDDDDLWVDEDDYDDAWSEGDAATQRGYRSMGTKRRGTKRDAFVPVDDDDIPVVRSSRVSRKLPPASASASSASTATTPNATPPPPPPPTTTTPSSSPRQRRRPQQTRVAQQAIDNDDNRPTNTSAAAADASSPKAAAGGGSGAGGSGGVIVVTKVKGYTVDVSSLWRRQRRRERKEEEGGGGGGDDDGWTTSSVVQYEVRMLLLRHHIDRSTVGGGGSGDGKDGSEKGGGGSTADFVEERTVRRTLSDLRDLITSLMHECSRCEAASSVGTEGSTDRLVRKRKNGVTDAFAALGELRRAEADLRGDDNGEGGGRSRRRAGGAFVSDVAEEYQAIQVGVPRCDRAIRRLASHPDLCNARQFRDFLGLSSSMPPPPPPPSSSPLHNNDGSSTGGYAPGRTAARTLLVAPGESTTDFVRRWLQSEEGSATASDRAGLVVLLAAKRCHPAVASVVAATVLWPIGRAVCRAMSSTLPSSRRLVSIRVDAYLATLAVAAWIGYELGRRGSIGTGAVAPSAIAAGQRRHRVSKRRNPGKEEEEAEEAMTAASRTTPAVDGDNSAFVDTHSSTTDDEDVSSSDGVLQADLDDEEDGLGGPVSPDDTGELVLSSPLPSYPDNEGMSCWSKPEESIFKVRGCTYLKDRVKVSSEPAPFTCRGVDVWITDNAERHIARHPAVLGGRLAEKDTFIVNFLLPFCNFVAYFSIPPLEEFPPNVARVWSKFLRGDQQYRDARLKLLPVVVEGPWIVRKAVGPGTAPALLGKVVPLQYYFTGPSEDGRRKGVYEVDVIISASRIANGILNVVKGHTKALTIAFAFIIEAAEEEELPENVLCSFQMHALHLEHCPQLPHYILDE